jgi:hypothetical protein
LQQSGRFSAVRTTILFFIITPERQTAALCGGIFMPKEVAALPRMINMLLNFDWDD